MIPIHLFLISPCFFLILTFTFFSTTEMLLFVQLQLPLPLPSPLPLTLPHTFPLYLPPSLTLSPFLPPFLPPSLLHYLFLYLISSFLPSYPPSYFPRPPTLFFYLISIASYPLQLLPYNKHIPYVRTSVLDVFCYNSWTEMLCNGNEGRNCSCLAKVT